MIKYLVIQIKIISKWYYLKFIAIGIQQGTYKSFIPMFTTLEEYVQVDVMNNRTFEHRLQHAATA